MWVWGVVPKKRRLQQIVPNNLEPFFRPTHGARSFFVLFAFSLDVYLWFLNAFLIQMYLYVAFFTFFILLIILSQTVKKKPNKSKRVATLSTKTRRRSADRV